MNFKTKRHLLKLKNSIYKILKIIVGTVLMAISIDLFLLPNQLTVGGFSGIGTIVYYFLKIPVGTTVLILNIPLFLLALFRNGKRFFLDSLLGTFFLSLFLNLFENVKIVTNSSFLACIYGGIISRNRNIYYS